MTNSTLPNKRSIPQAKGKLRKLYQPNNTDTWTYVEPIPESRTRVDGSIVQNNERNQVILIMISERKPRISRFFKEWQPRAVLLFKQEYDLTNVTVPMWAMLAIAHDYGKITSELSGPCK